MDKFFNYSLYFTKGIIKSKLTISTVLTTVTIWTETTFYSFVQIACAKVAAIDWTFIC